jgi:hypothetical protein
MQAKYIRTQNRRGHQQTPLSAVALDRYLTQQLHKTGGFKAVRLAAGYRLRAPDARGCNWSGDITVIHGTHAPLSGPIAAALRPIVKEARLRFNLID